MEENKKEENFLEIEENPGIISDFWEFLKHSKKWWLIPVIVILLLLGLIIIMGSSSITPFIYAMF